MNQDSNSQPRLAALLLAAVFPGLGHLVSHQVGRGLLVMTGVLGLFLGGMLIGGIGVVDSQENRVWFIGEALVGPLAFSVDWAHQNHFRAYDPAAQGITSAGELARMKKRSAYPGEAREVVSITVSDPSPNDPSRAVTRGLSVPIFRKAGPGEGPPNRTSFGKVNELGTLFATIGGMMNLIAIIDAGFPGRPKRQTPRLRQVGLKTELADAEAPLGTPAVGNDPLQGGTPGVKP